MADVAVVGSVGGTPGEAFRLVAVGFAAYVGGVWLAVAWWQTRYGRWRRLATHDAMLGVALFMFIIGFLAIQIEAVFINPKAVLLWGNFLFPIGMAAMLVWLLQVVTRYKPGETSDRRTRRDERGTP